MDTLTEERLQREFDVTEKALKVKIKVPKDHELYEAAEKCLDTAQRYYSDAQFFRKKGDKASAFGALNYAFGWIDAGKYIGLLEEE